MREVDLRPGETAGNLASGGLALIQKEKGYRFSVDSYLLAAFVDEAMDSSVLEIGSGSGVVSILLAGIKSLRMTGIEIQPELAEMSKRSVMMNGLEDRISICLADIKEFTGGPFDAVVTNPPYRPVGSGRINPFSEKAIARHEIKLELDDMLACSRMLLKESGRFYAIYPAWRMPDMFCKMRNYDIEPKRIAMVHSHAASRASLFLVKGIKGAGREMSADAPMIVYESGKEYSDRMKRLFRTLNFI